MSDIVDRPEASDAPTVVEPPRWGEQTARSLEVLSFSGRRLADLPELVTALAHVKGAAAEANTSAGVLDDALGAAVQDAARAVAAGGHADAFVADPLAGGGAIAVHANVNEVLADLANEVLGGRRGEPGVVTTRHTSSGQSTADVVHTAARLAVLDRLDGLDRALARVVAEVRAVADRVDGIPTLGRTCLRDGLEVPARLLFDGAAATLGRQRASLAADASPLHEVTLGSTVVGTGAGADVAYRALVVDDLARWTNRAVVAAPVPAAALQHGDDLAAVSSALLHVSATVAKLAQDLRLLGSGPEGGFGEVLLPAVMEGSTFFTGKQNPAVPETVVQCAIQVSGCDAIVRGVTGRAELHLSPYDLAAAVAVCDAARMLTRASHLLVDQALVGLRLDEARCRALAGHATPYRAGDSQR